MNPPAIMAVICVQLKEFLVNGTVIEGCVLKCRLVGLSVPWQPQSLIRLPRLLGDKQPYHLSIAEQVVSYMGMCRTGQSTHRSLGVVGLTRQQREYSITGSTVDHVEPSLCEREG